MHELLQYLIIRKLDMIRRIHNTSNFESLIILFFNRVYRRKMASKEREELFGLDPTMRLSADFSRSENAASQAKL